MEEPRRMHAPRYTARRHARPSDPEADLHATGKTSMIVRSNLTKKQQKYHKFLEYGISSSVVYFQNIAM